MACHGAEGKGNPALGAPNLSDKTWLHGGSVATIMETVRGGRNNVMPAFNFLNDYQIADLLSFVRTSFACCNSTLQVETHRRQSFLQLAEW